ncbi:hypothetical protein DACRYDRAFT_23582 [Dacryopinax primogenitus]|uniref:Uncharacterized protein n=1 Tax=Dacryopinax primogenitus (strain DJM 731) TaxID=1858805 RepID=M5G8H2_DACPD|nr:uncharacterized protein DACRYDRAFT_23582 [Dacryopinax primogenitus]EJU00063.1 hypothetical protein DACRYDRAFT_23582 [Dacryopinax primogenitus]
MSTASSASSISLPLPYRPSTSSDTFPLLPSIPQSPVDLTRPETTNLLDPTQKEVLRRRTRKLEQLLGTTHFRSGGFEDGTTVDASRSIKRDSGREQADRRTSSTGTRLVRSRTASGPPTTKTQGGRFCVPLSSSLQRIASISTLNSDGVPVSSPSIGASSDWEDDPTEKEKRRRRQTLQKIHRYLGVVVPADLVAPSSSGLGAPLPLPAEPPVAGPIWPYEDKKQTTWKTLFTRSSGPPKLDESVWKPSAVGVGVGTRRVDARRQEPQAQASPDEHARNVKRAAKMEQLFGSPPPPALYLSRPAGTPFSPTADSPVSPNTPLVLGTRRRAKSQDSPARPRFDGIIVTTEEEIEIEILEPGPMSQSYGAVGLGIGQKQKQKRERIKSDGDAVDHAGDCHEVSEMGELSADDVQGESFKSYRRSLASLDYLTQAGNRNSLATLLQFVSQSDNLDGNDPLPTPPRSSSLTPSSHVLSSTVPADIMIPRPSAQDPETASLVSFAMSTHDPTEIAPAPPAWKRAAKLRKFFGVTYRELFDQLLEKIETGAREDLERGLLSKEEFEIVVKDLRALRDRREGLSSDLVR